MASHQCFIIMPFGEKPDINGDLINFDKIYNFMIKPAITDLGIDCIRCDEVGKPGWIHAEMIEHLYKDDIAVVDITTLNANVFYELGVRHALRGSVTVLIRKKGTKLPFNIQGFNVIEYDHQDLESVEDTKGKIKEYVRNGLKASNVDSLVHTILPLKILTEPSVIRETNHILYSLTNNPNKHICLTTGDINRIKGIDVWVSSENTNMQMARFYDHSISSIIRYLGAEKNQAGLVVKDTIADALLGIVDGQTVPPATIIETTAGMLTETHGVKRIFHAASVYGSIGRGYAPIQNIADCITNSLAKADSSELKSLGINSILFPLMGAGTAGGNLRTLVSPMIDAAIQYLRETPNSCIQTAHFAVYTKDELAACLSVLDGSKAVARA
jgi:O-acetyl-ADP-ribose deacetylase (regulator of RNase III)